MSPRGRFRPPIAVTAVKPGVSVTFTRNPDYWGRDLPINRGFWNFDEIKFDFYRESNGLFEAFKRRSLRLSRRDPSRLYRHEGYDFAAARDGQVIRDTIRTGMPPQPSQFSGVQYTASKILRCERSARP